MYLKKISIGLMLVLLALTTRISCADEAADRQKIEVTVQQLSINENFAELEQMARTFRAPQARTSSGLWKLTLFYIGLSRSLKDDRNDDQVWSGIEARISKWQRAYPDSAVAQLAYAEMLINRA
ncbi:MAG: hypothetical protein HYR68_14290, partial [Burkholderiales bacterium]|nr:hypothetical protein [Burkholderiales bacterium]